MKTVHKTYAIPVFESVFPTQFDYRGTTEGGNVYFELDTRTEAFFKYSDMQNKFSGYYKLIPLNVLSVKTSANKESNNFTLEFLPNYVFIATDNELTLPKNIQTLIQEESINIEVFSEEFPFIYNVYSSLTSELDKKFIVKSIDIMRLISEMDVVSIYLVRLPEYLDETAISIFIGKRPGRLKDRELISLKSSNQNKIKQFGVDLDELINLNLDDFKSSLYIFKKFSGSLLIRKDTLTGTNQIFLFDKNTRENIKNAEINTILKKENRTPSAFLNAFGLEIYNEYYKLLDQPIDNKKGAKKVSEVLAEIIKNYYASESIYSKLMSWSAFEAIRLKLRRISNGALTIGKAYSRSADLENKSNFKLVLDAVVIENLINIFSSFLFSDSDESKYKAELSRIATTLKNSDTIYGKNFSPSFALYYGGIRALLSALKKYAEKDLFSSKEVQEQFSISRNELQNIKIPTPIGGNGLSLVMRGHVTSISESSSIDTSGASKRISIKGKGFELPLERSQINFDLTSPKFLATPTTNFSVAINTPLESAKIILENFAPKRVKIMKLDKSRFNLEILRNRGYEVWIKSGSGDFPYIVLQGNTIAPSYDSDYEDLRIFTPIHYVSTNLLEKVTVAFNNFNLTTKFVAGVNRTVQNTSILAAIKDVISSNSMYRVFVDSWGELNVQYEPANISIPFSLSLIDPVQEENTISLNYTSDESNVTTFVEVVPTSLAINTPSSVGIPAIYGRAVSESIFDFENTTTYINYENKGKNYLKFLDVSINILLAELLNLKKYILPTANEGLKQQLFLLKTFANKNSEKNIVKYIKNQTVKKAITTTESRTVLKEQTTTTTLEFCDGTTTSTATIQVPSVEEVTVQKVQNVTIELFNPESLSLLFSTNTTAIQSLNTPTDPNTLFPALATFNNSALDVDQLLQNICPKLNAQAALLGIEEAYVCYKENINLLTSLMVLGIGANGRTVENTFSLNSEYANYIKKYLLGSYISSSSSPSRILRNLADTTKKKDYSYFADFFLFSIPSTDVKNNINNAELYSKNIAPEFFLYGLRMKSFNDAFIGAIDAQKNKDKFATFRAEIFRQLNKAPIKTANVEIIGNPNYYVGYTTLVVNEKHSPINSYISIRTDRQLNSESKEENSIVGINEIVDLKEFQDLYKSQKLSIRGYYPPSTINSDIVFSYIKETIKNIISYAKDVKYVPASAVTGVFGAYTNNSFSSDSLGEYLKLYIDGATSLLPENQKNIPKLEDRYLDLITKYPEEVQQYQQIFVPQNYLVAQGHIESVSHSWAFSAGYRTNLNINYLFPALYFYLPIKGMKIILGYVVLDSPMYTLRENGTPNPILSNPKLTPLRLFMKDQMKAFYKAFTEPTNFVDIKRKLKFLEFYHKILYS